MFLTIESLPTRKVAGLPDTADVFGDGSCLLVSIPGHATGQLGILARTISGDALFFVADAAYSARAVREHVPFHPVTRLFTDSPKDAGDTLSLLHAYHARFPGTLILPTHCPEALARCAF